MVLVSLSSGLLILVDVLFHLCWGEFVLSLVVLSHEIELVDSNGMSTDCVGVFRTVLANQGLAVVTFFADLNDV